MKKLWWLFIVIILVLVIVYTTILPKIQENNFDKALKTIPKVGVSSEQETGQQNIPEDLLTIIGPGTSSKFYSVNYEDGKSGFKYSTSHDYPCNEINQFILENLKSRNGWKVILENKNEKEFLILYENDQYEILTLGSKASVNLCKTTSRVIMK